MRRLMFGMLALLGAFIFWQSASESSLELKELQKRGVVTLSEPIPNYTTQRRGNKTSHYLSFIIKVKDGQRVKGFQEVSYQLIKEFKPGMQVQVRYLPDRPGTMAIVGEEPSNGFLYFCAVLMGFLGSGLIGSTFMNRGK